MGLEVVALDAGWLDAYIAHRLRQGRESGRDGAPVTHFMADDELPGEESLRAGAQASWGLATSEVGWTQTWGACDGSRVVGHLGLKGPRLRASLHRANLGMGIERPWQGQGLGGRLMEAALAWARTQEGLRWIDLGVFASNEAALRLYRRHHFVIQGRTPDAFRVDGVGYEGVQMSLELPSRALGGG